MSAAMRERSVVAAIAAAVLALSSPAAADAPVLLGSGLTLRSQAPEIQLIGGGGWWSLGFDSAAARPYSHLILAHVFTNGHSNDLVSLTDRTPRAGAPACAVGADTVSIGYAALDGCPPYGPPYRLEVTPDSGDRRLGILGLRTNVGAYGFAADYATGDLVVRAPSGVEAMRVTPAGHVVIGGTDFTALAGKIGR